ncbi:hypothetical protein AAKU61_002673 [Undibacterium sp. GrIS 1.2]|uniref:YcxB family protein n=1 Tax=Undibacterium sp. GrIS 1.2 TaxID=3143933 RepID=UPI0033927944
MEYRLHYSNTIPEMLVFQWTHAARSPWYYVLFVFWSYAWFASVTEAWTSSSWSCLSCSVIYFSIMFAIVFITFLVLGSAPQLFQFFSKVHRASLAPRTIIISDTGLIEETSNSRAEYNWSAVQRILQTRSLVALYISPLGAHLIPKKAFESPAQWQQFNAFVEQHALNS